MFKKPNRKRNLRQREGDGETEEGGSGEGAGEGGEGEEEESAVVHRMADIREVQRARQRSAGLSAEALAAGSDEDRRQADLDDADPISSVGGGLIDLKALKRGKVKKSSVEETLKGNFSKETSLRDEDEEMRKFVEAEISRRKGVLDDAPSKASASKHAFHKDWEDKLYAVPDHLKVQSKKREEMMSNQMLVGIPEVELGLETKIRNIEETEAAKLRLLKEAEEKQRDVAEATSFNQDLVKDLAVDYVHHHQFNISKTTDLGKGEGPGGEKAAKELEELMGDADAFKVVGAKAVPYMLAEEFEGDLDDVVNKTVEGNSLEGGWW